MADDLYAQQARFIADLLAHNDAAALRMVKAYSPVYENLTRRWLVVLQEIVAVEETASVAELDLLRLRATRLDSLRRQTAVQIDRFARDAGREITAEQRLAVDLGQSHSASLTAASLARTAPGFEASFTRLPRGALEDLIGTLGDGSPLHVLLDTLGPGAADAASDVLFRALATGMNPRIAARELKQVLGVPLGRAMVISRSSMLDSYRSANLRSYQANRDVISGWRFIAHIGPRTCSACLALHNTVHFIDAFFPRHPNCRCSPAPFTKTYNQIIGTTDLREAPRLPTQRPGSELFREFSDADKLRVLGPKKLALYKAGKLSLIDTVVLRNDPRWGPSLSEASIAQSLAAHDHVAPDWLRFSLTG